MAGKKRKELETFKTKCPGRRDFCVHMFTFVDGAVVRDPLCQMASCSAHVRLTVSKVGGTHLCEGGMPLPPGHLNDKACRSCDSLNERASPN